ncbi:AlbA family DNA-binding domain-containing protein [Amycolatopsis sp. NBC_00438]|uniref:AlbA family DNA-binding domain-containing protein n=1 Tax=Amycolatopsis sp. NBC_00438 TaxID=2903558 RepID=UPI003FA4539D
MCRRRDGARDSLVAFANTRGGTLVPGLDEQAGFEPIGLSDPAKMSSDLGAMCATDIEPPLRPHIGWRPRNWAI